MQDDNSSQFLRATVLVVDDMPASIRILNEILAGDYRVLFATGGEQALAMTREQRPDIILLDVMMSGMDGYQVCRELKADPDCRDIPVIFVTGKEQPEDEELGFRIGAADFLTKPVRPATVRVRVSNQLQLRRSEELILHQALNDGLTGLPNRNLLTDRLRYQLAQGNRNHSQTAVLFIDLDNFKTINDTLGHDVGDRLLVEVAARLRECVRRVDTVGRLGGDEFLAILSDLKQVEDASRVAEEIQRSCARPFVLAGSGRRITTSIGVAVAPEDGDDPRRLLANADMAMYQAKNEGKNSCHLFNAEMRQQASQHLRLENLLHGALERGELLPYYQPIIRIADGSVLGAEALLRWNQPELGWIPPDRFIPIAEQDGLIGPIGAYVLEQGCRCFRDLSGADGRPLALSVNVSPQQFRQDDLPRMVQQVLAESGMSPDRLKLEVTEGLLLSSQDGIKSVLEEMLRMGVGLSMDDFGTGYSSLGYLRRFAFDLIKIDRSFVAEMTSNPPDEALVTAAIAMGKGLGLGVIAEGVETPQQLAMLVDKGCDQAQGYLFGKPMPFDDFVQWLAAAPAMDWNKPAAADAPVRAGSATDPVE